MATIYGQTPNYFIKYFLAGSDLDAAIFLDAATTIDSAIRTRELDILQLARDIYSTPSLDGDGKANRDVPLETVFLSLRDALFSQVSGFADALTSPSGLSLTASGTGTTPTTTKYYAVVAEDTPRRSEVSDEATLTYNTGQTPVLTFAPNTSAAKHYIYRGDASHVYREAITVTMNLQPLGTITATPSASGGSLASSVYYYKVTAIDANGVESRPSTEAQVTVTGPTGSVALSWSAVTGASSYRVYRGTQTEAEDTYYTSATNSFTDTGAAGTAGTPPSGARLSGGTFGAVSAPLLSAIGSLSSATLKLTTTVGFAAGQRVDVVDTYSYLRPSLTSVTASGTGSSFAAGSYSYRITAYDAYRESDASTAITVTLTAGQNAVISWQPVRDAQQYRIYRTDPGGTEYRVKTTAGTLSSGVLSYTDDGVSTEATASPQQTYYKLQTTISSIDTPNKSITLAATPATNLFRNYTLVSGRNPDVVFGDTITPRLDNTYDLGTIALRWRKLELGPGSLEMSSTTGTAGAGADYTLGKLSFSTTKLVLGTSAVGAGGAGTIQITTGANTGLNIDGSGNVGVQNASPSEALDVTGNIKASGTITSSATSGALGWWSRSGTTLSPVNASDAATIAGLLSATAAQQFSGVYGTTAQIGLQVTPTATAAATSTFYGGYIKATTPASLINTSTYGLYVDATTFGAGSSADANYTLYVAAPAAIGTFNAGAFIAGGLVSSGPIAISSSVGQPTFNMGLQISGTVTTSGTTQTGASVGPILSGTTISRAIYAGLNIKTNTAVTTGYGVYVDSPAAQAGGTVTTAVGLYINAQNLGGTNNYGAYIEAPSGGSGNNIGLYVAGGGIVATGQTITAGTVSATTMTGTLSTAAQPNVTSVGSLTGLTVASGSTDLSASSVKLVALQAAGDLVYGASGTALSRVALGAAGTILNVQPGATAPSWNSTISAGTDASTFLTLGSGGAAPTAVREIRLTLNVPHSAGNVGAIDFDLMRAGSRVWNIGIDSATTGAKASNTDLYFADSSFNYRMALSSNGRLSLYGDGDANTHLRLMKASAGGYAQITFNRSSDGAARAGVTYDNTNDRAYLGNSSAAVLTWDQSGNVGIGGAASAWASGYTASQVNNVGMVAVAANTSEGHLNFNSYWNGTQWTAYKTGPGATFQFNLASGNYLWYSAASATAGSAHTMTERLRLDSAGNLWLGTAGKTTTNAAHLGIGAGSTAGMSLWQNGVSDGYIAFNAYYNSGWKRWGAGYGYSITSQGANGLQFWYAGTSTADSAITWSARLNVDGPNNRIQLLPAGSVRWTFTDADFTRTGVSSGSLFYKWDDGAGAVLGYVARGESNEFTLSSYGGFAFDVGNTSGAYRAVSNARVTIDTAGSISVWQRTNATTGAGVQGPGLATFGNYWNSAAGPVLIGGYFMGSSDNNNTNPSRGRVIVVARDYISGTGYSDNNVAWFTSTASTYQLDVNGALHYTSAAASSDLRFKKNIKSIPNVLDKLSRIRGVSFEWNERVNSVREGYKLGRRTLGVIAQEVETEFPELVDTWQLDDEITDARAVQYDRFVPILVEAVKELDNERTALRTQVIGLEARITALESALKGRVN